jgi:hypothetical protein
MEKSIMFIYWHNGGLRLEPKSPEESTALEVLLDGVRLEAPPVTISTTRGGSEQVVENRSGVQQVRAV